MILSGGDRGCNWRTSIHNESTHPSTTALYLQRHYIHLCNQSTSARCQWCQFLYLQMKYSGHECVKILASLGTAPINFPNLKVLDPKNSTKIQFHNSVHLLSSILIIYIITVRKNSPEGHFGHKPPMPRVTQMRLWLRQSLSLSALTD